MEPIADENHKDEGIVCDDESFQINEKTETSVNNLCCGDLSVLGKIWIQALKTVLVGANFGLIPVVYASQPPPKDPEKPPKMKFNDLPIYTSPHADYQEFEKTKGTCPNANVKVLHNLLLPYVTRLRENSEDAYYSARCTAKCTLIQGINSVNDSKNQVKQYMRDPNNLQVRQGVLAGGTLLGYLLGGGGGIPRRVFYTSLGALAAGSLCFPKETDEIFKDVLYNATKLAILFYQITCRKPASVVSHMPCNANDGQPPLNKVEKTNRD